MSVMPSLSAITADRLSTCILDARLALAPGGLLLAVQLARLARLWVTRRFWTLIDGAYFYRDYPEELLPDGGDDSDRGVTIDALMLWHTAWLNGALDGVLFWIGDARRESALPVNWNSEIISRYERLSETFPAPASGQKGGEADPLTACGQEAFALAAALTAEAPVILTVLHKGDKPLICGEAADLAQIAIHGPVDWNPGAKWADRLVPDRISPLVRQLGHVGTRVAAVHTFAPAAVALPARPPIDEAVGDRADPAPDRRSWSGARVFWHELSQ
jgi:hypothetical protein